MASEQSPSSWPRRLLWAGAGLLLILAAAALALRLLAASGPGRAFAESRLEALSPAGQSIEIEGLQGDLLGRFSAERLEIADADGVWLVGEDLVFDWSPLALFSSHLDFERLAAERIALARRPALDANDEPDGEAGGLPVQRLTLDELAVAEIALAEGVAGPAARFHVEASVRHAPGGGALQATIAPLDAGEDRLLADLSWGDREMPLRGRAELNAPPGGVFATLARLEPDDGMSVDLTAEGAPGNWQARGEVRIAGANALEASAAAEGEVQTLSARADLSLHPLTRPLADRLGPRLELDAQRAPEGEMVLTLNAEALELTARALSEPVLARRMVIEASSRAPERLVGTDQVSAREISLLGEVQRDANALSFEGRLRGRHVIRRDWQVEEVSGPLKLRLTEATLAVTADLESTGLSAPGEVGQIAGQQPRLSLAGVWDRQAGALAIEQLDLDTPVLSAELVGRVSPELADLDLRGSLAFDGPTSGLAPVSADLDFRTRRSGGGSPQISIDGQLSDLPGLPDIVAGWASETADVSVRARLTGQNTIRVESARLSAPAYTLTANGSRFENGRIEARLQLAGDALTGEELELEPVSAELTVAGRPGDAVMASGWVQTAGLSYQGSEVSDIDFDAEGRWREGVLDAAVRLDAGVQGERLEARSDVRFAEGGDWSLDGLNAAWADLDVTGRLAGGPGGLAALTGEAEISGTPPAPVPAERIEISARLAESALRLDGELSGLSSGPLDGARLTMQATGTREAVRFDLALSEGDLMLAGIERPLNVQASGTAGDPLAGLASLELNATAALGRYEVATRGPITLQRTPQGRRIEGALDGFDGTLSAVLVQEDIGARLTGEMEGIDLATVLSLFGRLGPAGRLAATLDVDTAAETPTGRLEANITRLANPERDGAPVSLRLSGVLDADLVRFALEDTDAGGLTLDAQAELPVEPRGGPLGLPAPTGVPVSYTVDADGPIDPLTALLLPADLDLSGDADIALEGSWPSPRIHPSGRARLSAGRFEQGETGLSLGNLNFEAQFTETDLVLEQFSAVGPGGGTLSGSGQYALGGGTNTLRLVADEIAVLDRRGLEARASGTLTFEETAEAVVLTGVLTIDRAEIGIDALPTGGFTTLEVRFPQAGAGQGEPEEEESDSPIRLDIELNAPGRIFVSGRGLDAELSLDARITGTAEDPRIDGRARIVRGDFDLAGRRFVFSESDITIAGDVSDATLDITAVRTTSALEARINITGTPERPEISLTSTPELPEDEILSRILFGRSPSQLSALETAQLAGALSQLAGGGGFDLVGGLEDALGLDVLDFTVSQEGSAQVTTGQYLSEDVYLEVRTGMDGLPRVILEWRPRRNIEVEADVSSVEGQDLAIKWTRDFD